MSRNECRASCLSAGEMRGPVNGTAELKEAVSNVGKDKGRAIDQLESEIGMYEKLL